MPTFSFSDGETRKLVRFFEALSSQAEPYIAEKLDPLTDNERTMARNLFTSEGSPCLKCHMTGDPKHDSHATAPNFTVAKDRLKPGSTKRWILHPPLMSPLPPIPPALLLMSTDLYHFTR